MPFSEKCKKFILDNPRHKKETVDIMEIGPKHGVDTEFMLNNFNVNSYTIFELEEKNG